MPVLMLNATNEIDFQFVNSFTYTISWMIKKFFSRYLNSSDDMEIL